MAAITTIHTFGGTGFTGFTELGGGVSESAGNLVADNNAVDCGLIRDASFTETNTNAANGTKGTIQRFTLGTTPTAGSKIRFLINYVDADNYHYAELHKGGVEVFADLDNDRVTLWKRVAGVESQIGSGTAALYTQQITGDLRHQVFEAGDRVTIMKVLNQYVVKVTTTDPYGELDWEDVIHLTESDGAVSAANEQAGVIFVGDGAHSNSISIWQGGLITCHYTTKTGSDSANGSQSAPFLTIRKLMETVDVNQHGWIGAGTYNEAIGAGLSAPYNSTLLKNGTSWEDAPTFMPLSGESVTQTYTGHACYAIKATSTVKALYRVFFGWTMDGLNQSDRVVAFSGQQVGGSGHTSKRTRWQRMTCTRHNLGGAGGFFVAQGIFSGTPTTDDFETYHHWIDSTFSDGNSSGGTGSHGGYIETSRNMLEYCRCEGNAGNGWKYSYGTASGFNGVQLVNNNVARFCVSDGNAKYGLLIYGGGTGNTIHHSIGSNSSDANEGSGIGIFRGCKDALVYDCVVYGNAVAGIEIDSRNAVGIDGVDLVNITSYGNRWNYCMHTGSFGGAVTEPTNILFMNCSAYGHTGTSSADFAYVVNGVFYSLTTENPTYGVGTITYTTNHETADVSGPFGSVFGNPLFISAGTGDFRLSADTSPLVGVGTLPTSYHDGADFDRRVQQSDGPVIGAFHFPDPFVGVPVNVLFPTYQIVASAPSILGLTVSHAANDIAGDATSEEGVWIKLDLTGYGGTVTLTATESGTGHVVKA